MSRPGLATIGTIALAASAGVAAQRSTPLPQLPDHSHIGFTLPANLKWEGPAGEQRAKLYGDPDQPGPYGILYRWGPGHNSKPHTHAVDRYGYVVSGTWWMSSSAREDKTTLYPVPAGSAVVHRAGQVHWDGGVGDTALVLVTGVGPIQTKRVAQ